MQRVEPQSAVTAMFADHGLAVSTSALSSRPSSSLIASAFPVSFVSIICLGIIALLGALVLIGLVLSGPAMLRIRGESGATPSDTRTLLGG